MITVFLQIVFIALAVAGVCLLAEDCLENRRMNRELIALNKRLQKAIDLIKASSEEAENP